MLKENQTEAQRRADLNNADMSKLSYGVVDGLGRGTTVIRFHIYVLAYGICFSLSDLLHSV